MHFRCKNLTINDDPNFGCTIEFSDSNQDDDEFTSLEDMMNRKDKYLLIQRSYPEERYDQDWYSVESSESKSELDHRDNIYIRLKRNSIDLTWALERVTIGLELTDSEYNKLKTTLLTRFKDRITLL